MTVLRRPAAGWCSLAQGFIYFLTREYGRSVGGGEVTNQTDFANVHAIVSLCSTTFYVVICDVNMTRRTTQDNATTVTFSHHNK